MSRAARTLLLAVLLALGSGGTASAGIWTPITSGTTENITAIDYQGGDRFWFATANGTIRYREGGVFKTAAGPTPGVVFNDIAFKPGANVGLAVGNANNVWRSTDGGRNWTKLIGLTTLDQNCFSPTGLPPTVPIGDMFAIAWGPNGVVYLGGDENTVLRSPGTDGDSFAEVNKKPGSCSINAEGFSDLFFFPNATSRNDEQLYLQERAAFGQIFRTSDGLQSAAVEKASSNNGTEAHSNLAVDPVNTNRLWGTDECGFTCLYRSEDGASDFECVCTFRNLNDENQIAWYDVEYSGGTVLVAGRGGQIGHSTNGIDFFYDKADGALLTKDWIAASMASASAAAVGGQGGALVTTTAANVIPDIVPPTGTIVGPATVKANAPTSFTLQASDEGGSGLNPASISWTSAGLPTRTGQTVQFAFPNTGFFTLRVAFADRAGNSNEATFSVTVEKGAAPVLPVSFTGPGNTLTAKIKGRFIRVTMKGTITLPAGATAAACEKRVTLRIKKKKRVMAHRKARLRFKADPDRCTFSKKVKLKRKKVGKTKKLRLTVSHPGNTVLQKSSKKLTLVVKK